MQNTFSWYDLRVPRNIDGCGWSFMSSIGFAKLNVLSTVTKQFHVQILVLQLLLDVALSK